MQLTIPAREVERADPPGFGSRYLIGGDQTGGRFALIEHTIAPRTLAAPAHVHRDEDEYSFVLAGRLGALVGLQQRYGLEMDFSSMGALIERHGLRA